MFSTLFWIETLEILLILQYGLLKKLVSHIKLIILKVLLQKRYSFKKSFSKCLFKREQLFGLLSRHLINGLDEITSNHVKLQFQL